MPWNKTNYPNSMKNLPAAVRNKAIEIANAILKEHKKMDEGKLIATAIKRAKNFAAVGKKIGIEKKKIQRVALKPAKKATKKKPEPVVKRKVKKPAELQTKSRAKHRVKTPVTQLPVAETLHGEDLHLIPVEGEIQIINAEKVAQRENIFHHNQEVAFHQENQKMKAAMSSRKNAKRIYRITGRR